MKLDGFHHFSVQQPERQYAENMREFISQVQTLQRMLAQRVFRPEKIIDMAFLLSKGCRTRAMPSKKWSGKCITGMPLEASVVCSRGKPAIGG